eukprot:TRINITY_DN7910_c0_g1_i1.p1 TRINITY_DN7910_c0_g1~~TRINITY_DN7910_c0_g1_i1.p1  ORF type:complete len:306 (-),score=72.14 TRINITY_DN7910_c0_g1_i1:362-1279(-)
MFSELSDEGFFAYLKQYNDEQNAALQTAIAGLGMSTQLPSMPGLTAEAAKDFAAKGSNDDLSGPSGIGDSRDTRMPFDGVHPEIEEMCQRYNVDERAMRRLNTCMKERRQDTWTEDMEKLWEVCEGARNNPSALLMKKVNDMYAGTFLGKIKVKDAKVQELAKKYKLDDMAKQQLAEALIHREEQRTYILTNVERHLETANSASKTVMRLLSFIMKNQPLPEPNGGGGGRRDDRGRGGGGDRDRDRDSDRRGGDRDRDERRGGDRDRGDRDQDRRGGGGDSRRSRSRSRDDRRRRSRSRGGRGGR